MSFSLTMIALVWLAGSAILLPLVIVTVRAAIIPLVETITRCRPATAASSEADRLARLEERVGQLGRELEQLTRGSTAAREF